MDSFGLGHKRQSRPGFSTATLVAWGIALVALGLIVLAAPNASAATFTVNDVGNAGDAAVGDNACATAGAVCTLRAAIEEANAASSVDTIVFDSGVFTTASPVTILVTSSPLPALSQPVTIDAFPNIGSGGAPGVVVSGNGGSGARLAGNGFVLSSTTGVTLKNLRIRHFDTNGGAGIFIVQGTNTLDGLDVDDNNAGAGGGAYIAGGTNTFTSCRFGGNTASVGGGVYIGFVTTTNTFTSCRFDVNTATNAGGGVYMGDGTNTFTGSSFDGNTAASSGGGAGAYIDGGTNSFKGGSFSNNLGPGGDGIHIGIVAATSHTTIGGTGPGEGNTITGNGATGVLIRGNAAIQNPVRGNSISNNVALGIDLSGGGVTPNDPNDDDTGPNGLQNFPVITSITAASGETIAGTLNSVANQQYFLDFYANAACDTPGGNGEGKRYLGSTTQAPNGANTVAFSVIFGSEILNGEFITATATGPQGTSEFSACFLEPSPSNTNTVPDSSSIALGASNTDSATVTGAGPTPTGNVDFFICTPAQLVGGACPSSGTSLGSVSLVSGSATSPSFTPTSAGTWCYRGVYSGDANYVSSTDASTGECFTVNKAASTMVTTPTQATITLGDSNSDSATVSGLGGSFPTPTASVSFFICSPAQLTSGVCSSSGTFVSSNVLVSGAVTSFAFTPTSAGTWCYRGVYSGDGNYNPSTDASAGECFTVSAAASSTATAPTQAIITLGDSNSDQATVSGNAAGGTPAGSVSFFVCSPSELDGSGECSSGGTLVSTETLDGSGTATSPAFTPTSAGTWCFRGEYSGDGNYDPSSDFATSECFTVLKAESATLTTPDSASIVLGDSNSDSATVSGNDAGGTPTGNVAFFVCSPAQLSAGTCVSGAAAALGSVALGAGSATSTSFTPTSTGTWCFRGDYSGDSNYDPSTDATTGECFTVSAAASSTATAPTQAIITLGDSNSDQATVSGLGGSFPTPTGSVAFFACNGPCAAGGISLGSVAMVAGMATSASFTPSSPPGTWCFRGAYSGDANYNPSTDSSTGECFTVTPANSNTATTPSSASITLGATNSDAMTVTGNAAGGTPTGSASFFVCAPTQLTGGVCSTGGTLVSTNTLVGGAATSSAFTPTAAGTWCFRGAYGGDSNYNPSTDSSTNECFTVTTADTDNDGVPDTSDVCPGFDDALDFDGDGIPDGCDPDDDNDGSLDAADCNDFNAGIRPGATDIPGNGIDEDCVGGDASAGGRSSGGGASACRDGQDNDNDGFTDFGPGGDPGCSSASDGSEFGVACDDGVDNDGDGKIDFRSPATASTDPGCSSLTDNNERGTAVCDDGLDNDGDGRLDFRPTTGGDPGCASLADSDELNSLVQCDDGGDNDGDGKIDFRSPATATSDPGCSSLTDGDEHNSAVACDDGGDNDLDGLSDFKIVGGDPGCSSASDASEFGAACDDGVDNDGDGKTDFRSPATASTDPGCSSLTDADEHSAAVCDDGLDNDGDGRRDFKTTGGDPGCISLIDANERESGGPACDDGSDNDSDTRTDFPNDPGCTSPTDASEFGAAQCDDGVDNDNDGLKDFRASGGDPGCSSLTDTTETSGGNSSAG